MNTYNELMSSIDSACNGYISSNVASVANAIEPAAVTLLGVYVILWGFAHLQGLINEPILDAVKRVIKIGLIVGIGLRLGSYNTYVTDTFFNAPQDLANALAGGTPTSGIINSLDTILAKAFDIGGIFWDKAGFFSTGSSVSAYFMAFFIWTTGIIVTAYAGFLIILSKIALAIIISLGPLFIVSLLFDASKRFFEAWVAQLANYFLVVVLVVASNLFTIKLFAKAAEGAAALGGNVEIVQLLPFFVTAGVSLLVLAQVPSMAAGLAGGISLSSFGLGRLSLSLFSRTARQTYRRGKQGLQTAGRSVKYAARRPMTYYRNRRRNTVERNDRHRS